MVDVPIARLIDIAGWPRLVAGIEAIMFAASGRTFEGAPERATFQERWVDRYLEHDPKRTFVALLDGKVAGYVIGSHDDPALAHRFADLPFFAALAPLTKAYPAQLHINLDARFRNRGIGQQLIEAFVADARAAGVTGLHIVTGAAARNVGFYERVGFRAAACTRANGAGLLMMVRDV